MKTINFSSEFAEIQISVKHLAALTNACIEVVYHISPDEFHARIGVYPEEFRDVLNSLVWIKDRPDLHDKIEINNYRVSFSYNTLITLSQALNEVCNGFLLHEFESKIGLCREETSSLIRLINQLIEKMESNFYQ